MLHIIHIRLHLLNSGPHLNQTVMNNNTVDTGDKFATDVVDTSVHLDLRISPRIVDKIRNDPNVIFRGLGEDDS
jgi:hypothetical protein